MEWQLIATRRNMIRYCDSGLIFSLPLATNPLVDRDAQHKNISRRRHVMTLRQRRSMLRFHRQQVTKNRDPLDGTRNFTKPGRIFHTRANVSHLSQFATSFDFGVMDRPTRLHAHTNTCRGNAVIIHRTSRGRHAGYGFYFGVCVFEITGLVDREVTNRWLPDALVGLRLRQTCLLSRRPSKRPTLATQVRKFIRSAMTSISLSAHPVP